MSSIDHSVRDAEVLVKIRDLSVSYGGKRVLNAISLSVHRGDFVSIVGLSGSGKTTLLNTIAGFLPCLGEVRVSGRVGVVFQDYAAFPFMTVYNNIAFGLEKHNRQEKRRIVTNLLARTGLQEHARKYPAQLSGGQVQRVGLARALAPDPELILMDEPYGALDRHTRDRMQQWLLQVWAETHKTVLFVTHDMDEAIYLSNRVVVVANGIIVKEFPIPFPRPRSDEIKFTPAFASLSKAILESMQLQSASG